MDNLNGPNSVNCYMNFKKKKKLRWASLVSNGIDPMTYQSHYLQWLITTPQFTQT